MSRVESFSWTRTIADDGSEVVELPNITLTISMQDLRPWSDWAQAVLATGDETLIRGGTITYLAPDLTKELGRVELAGLLPNVLAFDSEEANKEEIARFTVELSCQGLQFESDAKL